jgi:hypothetical protein
MKLAPTTTAFLLSLLLMGDCHRRPGVNMRLVGTGIGRRMGSAPWRQRRRDMRGILDEAAGVDVQAVRW